MTIDLSGLDGHKTYISIALYVGYLIAVQHGFLAANPDIEMTLKAAIGMSFAHKVSKLNTGTSPEEKKDAK